MEEQLRPTQKGNITPLEKEPDVATNWSDVYSVRTAVTMQGTGRQVGDTVTVRS